MNKNIIKFCAGIIIYAFVVWGLSFLDDYRVGFAVILVLNFVSFCMALWALLRNRPVITGVLIACLAICPIRASEPPSDPQPKIIKEICVGGVILVVGYVVIKNLLKLCKKLPPPNPPNNPPATNDPDALIFTAKVTQPLIGTNGPSLIWPVTKNIASNAWDVVVLTMQCSTNARDWRDVYAISNWFLNEQAVSIIYSNNLPLKTNFYAASFAFNYTNPPVIVDFSGTVPVGREPLMMWRTVLLE